MFFEFHILKGGLTDWSRRNPPSRFPSDFKNVVDIACGIVWEIEEGVKGGQTVFTKERVWFWGANWIWMFDLQQDLLDPETVHPAITEYPFNSQSNKRKRGATTRGKIKDVIFSKPADGADGADMPHSSKTTPSHDDQNLQDREDGDVQDSSWGTSSRTKLANVDATRPGGSASSSKPNWRYYKYRPIMALLPIGEWVPCVNGGGKENDAARIKEMVVVERPAWDIELPPRFFGKREKTDQLRKGAWV